MTANANTNAAESRDNMISRVFVLVYDRLRGYVSRRIGNQADVEDIVQDTFEALLRPGLLISEQTVERYVFSIAHNRVVDWYRRHACSIKAQEYFFAHSPVLSEDADVKVNVADIVRVERETLMATGDKGRCIYDMYVHQGQTVKEISGILSLSERTVENHVFRVRNKVRTALKQAM